MYIPKHFREDDLDTLHKFMQAYSFATLITQHEGVPFATHLPFILDSRARSKWHVTCPYGTCQSSVA